MTTGVCSTPACRHAAGAEPVEIYPGPGQYCPACGERLEPLADAVPEPITLEAYEHARERMLTSLAEAPPARRGSKRVAVLAAVAFALAVAAGFGVVAVWPAVIGRPAAAGVQVCGSSLTERLARDMVRSYAAKSGTPGSQFVVAGGGACDVRFSARAGGGADAAIAHDGIVAVVNPQNPLARLSAGQLRRIVAGGATDWSQVGGRRGAIVALLPGGETDEGRALAETLLRGVTPGSGVRRLGSSAEIVRVVASASGRGTIGLVAFSAAVPAKVLALGSAPAPSVLSIASHRYPLSLAVTAGAEGSSRDAAAIGLVDYAHSDEAQSIVVRDGLIAKRGF